jgi:hypothetical protein
MQFSPLIRVPQEALPEALPDASEEREDEAANHEALLFGPQSAFLRVRMSQLSTVEARDPDASTAAMPVCSERGRRMSHHEKASPPRNHESCSAPAPQRTPSSVGEFTHPNTPPSCEARGVSTGVAVGGGGLGVVGCGWVWMGVVGGGWGWMGVDGCGWVWMGVDGCGWGCRPSLEKCQISMGFWTARSPNE